MEGELNGPAQEFDGEGHLVFKGQYKDNNRCGECWVYYPVSQLSAHYSTATMFTCIESSLGYMSLSPPEATFVSIFITTRSSVWHSMFLKALLQT